MSEQRDHHFAFNLVTEHGHMSAAFTFTAEAIAPNLASFYAVTMGALDEHPATDMQIDGHTVAGATLGEQLDALGKMFPAPGAAPIGAWGERGGEA